ncbi:uncharacterized protein PgNI_12524, partial [Pyricularia grisea]|uniref:AAA+ ATPase domain-containing protein n=1 Tax=Pyricularia grisea TaxID=148305 RepID=A0A6P8AM76_PYRGI
RHDGRLLIIRRISAKPPGRTPDKYASPPDGKEPLVILCLGWCLSPIDKFLRHCCEFKDKQRKSFVTVHIRQNRDLGGRADWDTTLSKAKRSLNTVYLKDDTKKQLISDIEDYLRASTRKYYHDRGIPYRRGYLLHGPPGTGKTSLSLALASELNLDVYMLHIPNVRHKNELTTLFTKLPPSCIVLLEDVDAVGLQRRHASHSDSEDESGSEGGIPGAFGRRSACSLSGLLNSLDGVASPEGRIIIMTTNNIEKLDEALIRDGRVDKKVFLGYMDSDSARLMFMKMYQLQSDSLPSLEVENNTNQQTCQSVDDKSTHIDLENLAQNFASLITTKSLSAAKVQGYLLCHKDNPQAAVANLPHFMDNQPATGINRGCPQQQHNTAKMLPSISTNHSENSAHSPGTSPVASPASDAGTSASSCTITACDKRQISVPVRLPQKNRRFARTKKPKARIYLPPSSKRSSPKRSILKDKSDPSPPSLDPRDFPRLSLSQLLENAIDDDDANETYPPASRILPVRSRPGSSGPNSRQTSKSQSVEYHVGKTLLRVVGFEYSPKRSLSDRELRSSLRFEAMTRSPTIVTDEMPKQLFELGPEWGEQPRKAPPSPAKSDMRRDKEGQFGQFGEIFTPFRCESRARGSVSSGNVDELYLACERAALRWGLSLQIYTVVLFAKASNLSKGFASRCPDPRPRQVPGAASTSKGQREQQLQPTEDLPPLQTTPTHPNSKKAASTADLPMEPSRSGRSTVGYFPADARSSTSHSSGSLIRSAERNPISPLEPIPEVQSVMRSQFKELNWADEQKKSDQDQKTDKQAQKKPSEQASKKDRESSRSRSDPRPAAAGRRPLRPFTIDKSGRRPSGGLVGRSTAQVHAAQTIGATFAPLPSVNTILRPVSSATTAKSTLSASPEAPPTATSIASPIFENMNPLPALRRAISDLIPERPAYPYDPLLDNYAPEQPFHIQWRRGSLDGQQSPVTTHMASPPIKSQRNSASTLPLSLDPNIMTTPSGTSHPGRPFVTESIARFGQQR